MADVSTAHLESLRASCLAAMTACQSAIQHVEALIADADGGDTDAPAADEYSHLTFEDSPAPIRRPNGRKR